MASKGRPKDVRANPVRNLFGPQQPVIFLGIPISGWYEAEGIILELQGSQAPTRRTICRWARELSTYFGPPPNDCIFATRKRGRKPRQVPPVTPPEAA